MIKVPQLDDLTYEQIVQRAVSRIPSMTDQWTDFNSHDPGITVLQTYAWLVDMLNYYMNATGDIHVLKYLKLLGMEPQEGKASEAFLALEGEAGDIMVPAGIRFYAGNIPFETAEDQNCRMNRFCSCISEGDAGAVNLTAFAGADGDYAEIFSGNPGKGSVLYLGFEKALQDGDRLYINVKEDGRRNPFGMDFELCRLKWQYRTKGGWQELKTEDGTCGFLKTGFIRVYPEMGHTGWIHPAGEGTAYYIRCILEENRYDVLPQIGMVYVNPLKVVQQYTVCREEMLLPELEIGRTNGCAGQELEFDYRDVYHFDLAVCAPTDGEDAAEHGKTYEIWKCTDQLDQASYKDRLFGWDEENRKIRFGDGIHGAVPAQGCTVRVVNLTCSRFADGNVLAGEIRRPDWENLRGYRIYNPYASTGGRDRERIRDMLEHLEETLSAQNRMASAQDYEERILKTPGLMIDLVHVIPGKKYGEIHRQNRSLNEVVAVVKPFGNSTKPVLSEAYRNRILQYVEPYRLLNTKVSIVSCEYVGIEVHGRILLSHDTEEVRERIRRCLEEETDYRGRKKPFGMTIPYGRLYTRLEALDGVKQVYSLSLERIGNAAEKSDSGDILIHEDALGILEQIDLEYC